VRNPFVKCSCFSNYNTHITIQLHYVYRSTYVNLVSFNALHGGWDTASDYTCDGKFLCTTFILDKLNGADVLIHLR